MWSLLPRLVAAAATLYTWSLKIGTVSSYSIKPSTPLKLMESRRSFVANSVAALGLALVPFPAHAVDIKVTPIAHTFVTSGGAIKPLRENDATRFLTNARVVYLLEGPDSNVDLPSEVLVLTVKRKAEQGPGVTPGQIHVAGSKSFVDYASSLGVSTQVLKELSAQTVAQAAAKLPEGDTLIVGPVNKSGGIAADGELVSDTAQALGTSVGGGKSGGVISVLLDGPRKDLAAEESGYPLSTILWYST